MPTAEDLLKQVEILKTKAQEHEKAQARATALEERARVDLEELTNKLESLFGTREWAEAEQLLLSLQKEAGEHVAKVRELLAGV